MKKIYYLLLTSFLLFQISCYVQPCAFNVDKVEIMASISIPDLTHRFYCDKVGNVKITCFEFNKNLLKASPIRSIKQYAEDYGFEKYSSENGRIFVDNLEHTSEDFEDYKGGGEVFYKKEGETDKEKWKVVLDAGTGKMWIRIEDLKVE